MRAHELGRLLLKGKNLPVHFSYNYGDHWRTEVAPEVEEVDEVEIIESAYHGMPRIATERDEEGDERTETVIVLKRY